MLHTQFISKLPLFCGAPSKAFKISPVESFIFDDEVPEHGDYGDDDGGHDGGHGTGGAAFAGNQLNITA